MPILCDIREEEQVAEAVARRRSSSFGGIDICVNNASAIQLTGTLETDMKRYDLMHQINARGTFLVSKTCIPHLKLAANPHILNLAPPLDMKAKWFKNHVAYTMAKFGMSMCTLGMSAEFAKDGIAVNSLWPLTAIDTAAVRNLLGGESVAAISRSPDIMADAALCDPVNRPSRETTGNFFIDELVLREAGRDRFLRLRAGRESAAGRRFLRAGRGVRAAAHQGGADIRLKLAPKSGCQAHQFRLRDGRGRVLLGLTSGRLHMVVVKATGDVRAGGNAFDFRQNLLVRPR